MQQRISISTILHQWFFPFKLASFLIAIKIICAFDSQLVRKSHFQNIRVIGMNRISSKRSPKNYAFVNSGVEEIMSLPTIDIKLELQMRGIDHRDSFEKRELAEKLHYARLQNTDLPCSNYQYYAEEASKIGESGIKRYLRARGVTFSQLSDLKELTHLYASTLASNKNDSIEIEDQQQPHTIYPKQTSYRYFDETIYDIPDSLSSTNFEPSRHTSIDPNDSSIENKNKASYDVNPEVIFVTDEVRGLSTRQLMSELDKMNIHYDMFASRENLEKKFIDHKISRYNFKMVDGKLRAPPNQTKYTKKNENFDGSYERIFQWTKKLSYNDICEELAYRGVSYKLNASFEELSQKLAHIVAEETDSLRTSNFDSDITETDITTDITGKDDGYYDPGRITIDAIDALFSYARIFFNGSEKLENNYNNLSPKSSLQESNSISVHPKKWLRRHANSIVRVAKSKASDSVGEISMSALKSVVRSAESAAAWAGGDIIAPEHILLGVSCYCLAFKRGLWSATVLFFAIRAARITIQKGFRRERVNRKSGNDDIFENSKLSKSNKKIVRKVLVRKKKPRKKVRSDSLE